MGQLFGKRSTIPPSPLPRDHLQTTPRGISALFPLRVHSPPIPRRNNTHFPAPILPVATSARNFSPFSRPSASLRHKASGASLQAELAQLALSRRLAHLPAVVPRTRKYPTSNTANNTHPATPPIIPTQQHHKKYPPTNKKKRPSPKRRTLNCGRIYKPSSVLQTDARRHPKKLLSFICRSLPPSNGRATLNCWYTWPCRMQ